MKPKKPIKKHRRPPDILRKGGPMKDKTKYNRKTDRSKDNEQD